MKPSKLLPELLPPLVKSGLCKYLSIFQARPLTMEPLQAFLPGSIRKQKTSKKSTLRRYSVMEIHGWVDNLG